MPNYRILRFGG
ncbi:hypothetical protein YPPY91_1589, partial [Yersinia pestis PY-91]